MWGGWPFGLESAARSSSEGMLKAPGFAEPLRIGPVSGGRERGQLTMGPIRVALGGEPRDVTLSKRRRVAPENAGDLMFAHDVNTQAGSISSEGNILKAEDFLKLSAALGHQLNHGWELSGQAAAGSKWEWTKSVDGQWNGKIGFNKANLTVAGLNQPLKISEGELDWIDGHRAARVGKVEGFGGMWTGNIEETSRSDPENGQQWKFHLTVDKLDAADLDRWVGPRARPNWLQRLLPTLLGGTAPSPPASELAGRGEFHLNKVEFRGWDVNASVADGAARTGVSYWATGECSLLLRDSSIFLDDFRLDGGKQSTLVNGTLRFGQNADLSIETVNAPKSKDRGTSNFSAGHVLKISGPLDGPTVSVEKSGVRQPAD